MQKTNTKDLKKNTFYYLTYDYWPHGGTKVKLVSHIPAKNVWSGMRGLAAKVKSENDMIFFIHPKAFLFDTVRSNEANPKTT